MTRQFTPGYIPPSLTGGLPFNVRRGLKNPRKPDDLVLQVWTPGGVWRDVEMRAIGMAHALFCENEDYLFPGAEQLGADYWRAFLHLCEEDWRSASKKLAQEKAWADRARRGVA